MAKDTAKALQEDNAAQLATEVEVNEEIQNEYVSVTVPRAPARADQTIMVSVNGMVYNIPRGKAVTVPRFVAEKIWDMIVRVEAYEAAVAETYNNQSVQYLNGLDR